MIDHCGFLKGIFPSQQLSLLRTLKKWPVPCSHAELKEIIYCWIIFIVLYECQKELCCTHHRMAFVEIWPTEQCSCRDDYRLFWRDSCMGFLIHALGIQLLFWQKCKHKTRPVNTRNKYLHPSHNWLSDINFKKQVSIEIFKIIYDTNRLCHLILHKFMNNPEQ